MKSSTKIDPRGPDHIWLIDSKDLQQIQKNLAKSDANDILRLINPETYVGTTVKDAMNLIVSTSFFEFLTVFVD